MGLPSYVAKRILLAIPSALVLLTVVFILMRVVPGDPIRVMFGVHANPEVIAAVRHEVGLDKPLALQYVDYMIKVLSGDLGKSLISHRSVAEDIATALPATIELTTTALVISLVIGILLGVVSAMRRGATDFFMRVVLLLGYSIPVFWLGLIFQMTVGKSGLLPIQGRYSTYMEVPRMTGFITLDSIITGNPKLFVDALLHLTLPALTLSVFMIAMIARISRANMIETLDSDYFMAALGKGLTFGQAVTKHALRNAIVPVVTVSGMLFALLLGGAVLTETVFAYPGMGLLLIQSLASRDYTVLQGTVTVFALAVVVVSTAIDVICGILDPRISY